MTAFAAAIAGATDQQLRDARRLLHVGVVRQLAIERRLGPPTIVDPPFPPLLAAACLELCAGLAGRGARDAACPACQSTVRPVATPAEVR